MKLAGPMLQVLLSLLLSFHAYSQGHDLDLLLSFKASINDPFKALSNWDSNSSPNFCNWNGITCGNSSRFVAAISLTGKNVSGKIPPSIFRLEFVESIDLSSNQFSGDIPRNAFSPASLKYLNLSNNNLTGSMPGGSIPGLQTLDLSNNMLSGKIPESMGLFTSFQKLDLGGNALKGEIPSSIFNITTLQVLTLASNQLSGSLSPKIGQLKSLNWIYLGYNNFSGEIPAEIGELTSLSHLDLVYNNFSGEIPSSLGNLQDLEYLFLYQNKLSGPIPRPIFSLKKLISLDLSDNSLSGEIPELISQLQRLEILHLFSNNFSGKIPNAVASLPRLRVLQLWSNNFSGPIPVGLGKHNNLTVLDLSTNSLTGKIPEGLCSSGNLFKLILFSNSLEGEIPKNLSSCRSLSRVRVQDNSLSGALPQGFTKLPLVYYLDLSGNNLSETITDQGWDMPSLELLNLAGNQFSGNLPGDFGSDKLENLDLSQNMLSGAIPESFGDFSELMQLKLNGNKLSGKIPGELSQCKKLVSLDLSKNQLSGEIPSSLSELPVLGELDLSENQLSGQVPTKLGRIESLVQVNISHNHLLGSLPSTGAFLAINRSAVAGNNLCGGDTVTELPPCNEAKNSIWWLFVICLLGALAVVAFAGFVFVVIRRKGGFEQKRIENEDGNWEMQFFDSGSSKSITIDDVLSSISEENNRISYVAKSFTTNCKFLVIELNDISSISPNLSIEVAEYGKLKHPNIVKLIGYLRSKRNAYLICEYVDGKKLSEIHGGLSWDRRRKIAIGVAKALRYLHHDCAPSAFASEISPENIIVDENDEARLQLSLPGQLGMDTKCFISSSYLAPEGRETKEINEKTDIWGFGLVLIGLLTGKTPSDEEFGTHESIVEWARYCYSDCHLDTWIDPAIRGCASDGPNEIVETMNLALQCTASDPTARPCARDVYKALMSVLKTRSCVSGTGLRFSSYV